MAKPIDVQPRRVSFVQKTQSHGTQRNLPLDQDKIKKLVKICSFPNRNGLRLLFSGPQTEAKSVAATFLALELKLSLHGLKLSAIASNYIGETEKNLDKILTEAEESNALLFFDEADALFGKRTEIKDAHNRYVNQSINYLLNRLENHKGPVILTTNSTVPAKDAFLRHVDFVVDFPSPKKKMPENMS